MGKLSFKSSPQAKGASKSKQPQQVRVARNAVGSALARRIGLGVLWSFAAVVVVYLCFVVTIVRFVPAGDLGFIPVKNLTFEGGMVPPGETVLVSLNNPQGSEILDHLQQAFIPTQDAALVQVEAGPWGEFLWTEPGIVTLKDGTLIDVAMSEEPESTLLNNAYLVKCVEGACEEGAGYIIPSTHILGSPIGKKE